jgi:hypothetical protein
MRIDLFGNIGSSNTRMCRFLRRVHVKIKSTNVQRKRKSPVVDI